MTSSSASAFSESRQAGGNVTHRAPCVDVGMASILNRAAYDVFFSLAAHDMRGGKARATGRAGDEGEEGASETEQIVVLVAEDERSIAETMAAIVADAGYLPVVARDGREALALARKYHPRLLITDLMMPRMSGADLIATLRQDATADGSVAALVIVVTAANRALAEQSGADVIIEKPFDVQAIEDAMLALLGA